MKGLYQFFSSDAAGGIVLMIAAAAAMVCANSPLLPLYTGFTAPTLFWINDLLMAFFFLFAGLEIKREMKVGALSTRAKAMLPLIAAAGGMLLPALVYLGLNRDTPAFHHGWAIPSATDIAFALGILALVSSRVPRSLKILLMAIAVIDDLGAILIIALFYTDHVAVLPLGIAAVTVAALMGLNRMKVMALAPYFILGAVLWIAMLKAGVHPTLAGVLLAFSIPMPKVIQVEHHLKSWVVFGILPLFGFANAGVSLAGLGLPDLLHPVTLGIGLGLFIGKQLGILGTIWVLVRLRVCALAADVTWRHIYGLSLLCGVGFTMALFIGGLAFTDPAMAVYVRMGVMGGSLLSAICGFAVLYKNPRK